MEILKEEKNFIEEAEKFIKEMKEHGYKDIKNGIIITDTGSNLVLGNKPIILSMISYILNNLYSENLIDKEELDKIVEVAMKSSEELEKEVLKSEGSMKQVLEKLEELAKMLDN